MIKKILSLFLGLALLLSCASALAGGEAVTVDVRGRFQLKGILPEGYTLTIPSQDETQLDGIISSGDPEAPVIKLYIAFNDSYAAVNTLADVSADDLSQIKDSFTEEYTVTFSDMNTAAGLPMLVTRGTDIPDFLDFYTIFLGHEIELALYYENDNANKTLTEDQLALCTEFARTLELVPLQ